MRKVFLFLPFFVCLICVFIPIDDNLISLAQSKLSPSLTHWFGTDLLGRDLFWRIIASFKISFVVGFGASSLSLVFALIFVVFFYFVCPALGYRIIELFLALPSLIFVMFVQSFFHGGVLTMIFVIALGHWAMIAKVLSDEIHKIHKQDFYQCSRMLGISKFRALWSEVLPACLNVLVILWILNFSHAIGNEATLSFFGLGIEPSKASLGNILADSAKAIFVGGWWMIVFPIAALMFMILPMLFSAHHFQRKEGYWNAGN
ncbi:ABC transporter permease [Helicobacter pametensis]|uniref:ABC transporter permease n=1 Tax=Helicobacter pametensis TaxID=95149 RepID=UPI00048787CC|nr:ABC transporter permease [Helicobacter pametensis]